MLVNNKLNVAGTLNNEIQINIFCIELLRPKLKVFSGQSINTNQV